MKSKSKSNIAQSKHAHQNYHAKILILDLPTMKSVTYRRLVEWLESMVKEFKREKDTKIFAKRYTARLMKK